MAVTPFAVVAIGARLALPRVGDAMARKLSAAVAVARAAPSLAPAPSSVATSASADGAPDGGDAVPKEAGVSKQAKLGGRRIAKGNPGASKPGVVVISAERVAAAIPQLRGIRATDATDAGRAAGARLAGVGALGVGLADGDVVTSIGGRATPTVDDAMAAAMAAYASGASVVQGTVLRGGETIAVSVGIPVVDAGR
jgi:hypothetical protein